MGGPDPPIFKAWFGPQPERIPTPQVVLELASLKRAIFMNSIIYLVGLVVIVMAILSFIGLA